MKLQNLKDLTVLVKAFKETTAERCSSLRDFEGFLLYYPTAALMLTQMTTLICICALNNVMDTELQHQEGGHSVCFSIHCTPVKVELSLPSVHISASLQGKEEQEWNTVLIHSA